jgi:hypothetical protein
MGEERMCALKESFGEDQPQALVKLVASISLLRTLLDIRKRTHGSTPVPEAIPHVLWWKERISQGTFTVLEALIRSWRKKLAGNLQRCQRLLKVDNSLHL